MAKDRKEGRRADWGKLFNFVLTLVVILLIVWIIVLSRRVSTLDYRPQQAATPTQVEYLMPSASTAMPVVTAVVVQSSALPLYESEGGIPYEGSVFNTDVAPDEMEVLTGGPADMFGVHLPGGEDRGTIIIMLPDSEGKVVVRYTVNGLLPGSNWHGSIRPLVNPDLIWQSIADDRILAMQATPNCSHGTGCKTIDVLVVDQNGVVKQWQVN